MDRGEEGATQQRKWYPWRECQTAACNHPAAPGPRWLQMTPRAPALLGSQPAYHNTDCSPPNFLAADHRRRTGNDKGYRIRPDGNPRCQQAEISPADAATRGRRQLEHLSGRPRPVDVSALYLMRRRRRVLAEALPLVRLDFLMSALEERDARIRFGTGCA